MAYSDHSLKVLKMKPLKQKISVTLDEDIIKDLRLLAEEDDRSLSQYINLVLRQHLRELEQKQQNSQ